MIYVKNKWALLLIVSILFHACVDRDIPQSWVSIDGKFYIDYERDKLILYSSSSPVYCQEFYRVQEQIFRCREGCYYGIHAGLKVEKHQLFLFADDTLDSKIFDHIDLPKTFLPLENSNFDSIVIEYRNIDKILRKVSFDNENNTLAHMIKDSNVSLGEKEFWGDKNYVVYKVFNKSEIISYKEGITNWRCY